MKRFLKWFLAIFILIVCFIYAFNLEYLIKGVRTIYLTGHSTAFLSDYNYFDNQKIISSNPEPWPLHKKYNTVNESESLRDLNVKRKTKSFLVIKNDSILFEKYFDGYDQNSLSNSFSVAKSIVVSMMFKAIQQGKIKSIDQPVGDFFTEYKEGLASKLTVGDLASMSSGMDWSEKYYKIINITSKSYFTNDLRDLILGQKIINSPGQGFRYSSGDTQLLAMVIEKATGTTLTNYLTENFWNPMQAENSALWQIDSKEKGMEKAYCCIAGTARDFARFGKLYINNGRWKDEQIIDSSFVQLAINPVFENTEFYGYGWWLYDFSGVDINTNKVYNKKVFSMNGHRGQFIISFPEDNIIIVRQGDLNKKDDKTGISLDLPQYIREGYELAKSIE